MKILVLSCSATVALIKFPSFYTYLKRTLPTHEVAIDIPFFTFGTTRGGKKEGRETKKPTTKKKIKPH